VPALATALRPGDCTVEPGSFRDRHARVLHLPEGFCRGLSGRALGEWEALSATVFFRRFTDEGKLVRTERIWPAPAAAAEWAAVLRHETIPFISYPYEWCFGMLRDAALLHLELLEAALAEDMTLRDGSAYNVQWRGARPVFIDIPSLARMSPGQAWVGYRQFCETFLYPLFLQACRGVAFQPWLRGSLEGLSAEQCRGLMSLRDLFRPGVFLHVWLQAKLQRLCAGTACDGQGELRSAGFRKELIQANVRKLQRTITRLTWKPASRAWASYEDRCPYSAAGRAEKVAFVRRVVSSQRWGLVWDLGCNTGTFARLAAHHARYVLALDRDAGAVERLYQDLRCTGQGSVLPLVYDLADPSPGLGWRGRERRPLHERGRPDLVLCLALAHHAVLAGNIPLPNFVDWLTGLAPNLVVEFVTRDDPMVQALLRPKDDPCADYDLAVFERRLGACMQIVRREVLSPGTRLLYFARAASPHQRVDE
jgi:hypothetical protein